jgi:small subunit ribosomal protein S17
MPEAIKKHRTLSGTVVSDKMQKTVVVRVDRLIQHPKYVRRYKVSKRYKVHDESGECHTGDRVLIEETRPLSGSKRWKVASKIAVISKSAPSSEEPVKEELPEEEASNNES